MYAKSSASGGISIQDLQTQLADVDPKTTDELNTIFQALCPRIIFNMGRHPDELAISHQIETSLLKNLSMCVEFFGYVSYDRQISESLMQKVPFLPTFPDSFAAEDIACIADRIIRLWDGQLNNTAEILSKKSHQIYQSRNVECVQQI